MPTPTPFERAEDYVAGRLATSERAQFETELGTNPELADETARLRAMRTGLRRLAFRDEMIARHAELVRSGAIQPVQPVMTVVRPLWQYMAIAASLVLLLGLGWFAWQLQSGPSPADLASRAIPASLRLNPTTRNGEPLITAPGPDQLVRRKAIARDTAAIRAGLTLLQQNQPAEAIARLLPARNCLLPDWQANARWLLALSYLQTDQIERAKTELTGLRQTTYFGTEAAQLLDQLQ